MESNNINEEKGPVKWQAEPRKGRIFAGIMAVVYGSLLLARQLGAELPPWIFKWEIFIIILGIHVGIKHRFRNPLWIILIGVSALFLISDLCPEFPIGPMIWPIVFIAAGIVMIFKPRRHCDPNWKRWEHKWKDKWEQENLHNPNNDTDDMIETVCVFGGVKKHVISKNFKGGEVTCVFGGAEINLMQSDFTGKAVMEFTQIFGGTKLIVPSHWQIEQHELVAVLGGIEDKREIMKDHVSDSGKILVLKGTCILGGLEIRTY